jgi:hypothetical protein
MNHPNQLARQFRGLYYGNSVGTNLKDILDGITWKQANQSVHSLNTISKLVYHMDYYIRAQIEVFEGRSLKARDKYSYDLEPIESQKDWEILKNKVFDNADRYYDCVKNMSEDQLWKDFWDEKYGNYYQNIHIILQHSYYHLGQIALIKKMILMGVR